MADPITGLVGIFDLSSGDENVSVGKSILQESAEESKFDPDFRTLVDPTEYKDGGIYRSIVKLQMRYEGQDENSPGWYMGTGWLIANDIMVTAGHNVYNWAGKLGKATIIKCHIGYHGKESIGKDGVQTRHAKRCVTSAEWLASKDNRHRDFAFIQVDRPFIGDLRLFSYAKTPPEGFEMLGVVGYPGDQEIKDSYGRPDKGAMMYKEFDKVNYNRTTKSGTPAMLAYRISTYGGQSGAPVIREGTQTGIATHVYGLGADLPNQASPITDYDNFFCAFTQKLPKAGDIEGIALHEPVAVTGAENSLGDIFRVPVPNGNSLPGTENTLDDGQESFLDVLKGVGRVVSTVGSFVVPTVATALLGPAGAPVAAVANAALSALGSISESTLDTDSIKSPEGAPERAVLAESALQTVLKLQEHDTKYPVLQKIHADMAKSYGQIAPAIPRLAEKLKPVLVEGAAIVGNTDYMAKNKGPRNTGRQRKPIQRTMVGPEAAGGSSPFEECILGDTKVVTGEEAFFEDVGNFFSKGFQAARPILCASAIAGLNAIANRLAASGKQESTLEDSEANKVSQAAKLVVQRAVLGESALQALSKLDSRELNGLTVKSGGTAQEESIGDFFNSAVQKIGSVVKTVAPVVVKYVLPHVIEAVKGLGQESALESTRGGLGAPQTPGLSRGSSRITLYNKPQDLNRSQRMLSVSALLPSHVFMTPDDVHKARESAPLYRRDSNEDLPPYSE